jgi:hypothetical protein
MSKSADFLGQAAGGSGYGPKPAQREKSSSDEQRRTALTAIVASSAWYERRASFVFRIKEHGCKPVA